MFPFRMTKVTAPEGTWRRRHSDTLKLPIGTTCQDRQRLLPSRRFVSQVRHIVNTRELPVSHNTKREEAGIRFDEKSLAAGNTDEATVILPEIAPGALLSSLSGVLLS